MTSHRVLSVGIAVALLGAFASAQVRTKPPREDELQKAQKIVADRFDADRRQRGTEARLQQAQHMLAAAKDPQFADPAVQFVLLRDASRNAALGGDAATAFDLLDQIGQRFDMEVLTMKGRAVALSSEAASTPDQKANVVNAAMELTQQLMDAGRYRELGPTLKSAEPAAGDLPAAIRQQWVNLQTIASEYEKNSALLEKASQGTATADEKLTAGKFYALAQQWPAAIKLLAESNDPKWSDAATTEAKPATGRDAAALARRWTIVAESEKGMLADSVQRHAAEIYAQATSAPAGEQSAQASPPQKGMFGAATDSRLLNLISRIDLRRDVVAGQATMVTGAISVRGSPALVEIPFNPPSEYDLEVKFVRPYGQSHITLVLGQGRSNFGLVMGADNQTARPVYALGAQNELLAADINPVMTNGQMNSVLVQVRRDGVVAFFNGQKFGNWQTDVSRLHMGDVRPRVPGRLGLATGGIAVFHEVKLTDRTGR